MFGGRDDTRGGKPSLFSDTDGTVNGVTARLSFAVANFDPMVRYGTVTYTIPLPLCSMITETSTFLPMSSS